MSIQLQQVQFSYSKSKLHKSQPLSPNNILNIPNWSVASGEKYFLHGPSGSGKSTLLNLVSGITAPQSGVVSVLGEELSKMSVRQRDKFRANNIGYIFQKFNLVDYLDALDNIKLAEHFSSNKSAGDLTKRIHELLEILQVNSKDWTRPVNQLSTGQQQRVAIARAFVNRPKLLIADEPTSALDMQARDSFMKQLTSLCESENSTLLFVSHDTQLTGHFDKVEALSNINTHASSHQGAE